MELGGDFALADVVQVQVEKGLCLVKNVHSHRCRCVDDMTSNVKQSPSYRSQGTVLRGARSRSEAALSAS